MDEETMKQLSDITLRLDSLTAVLCGYCDNFMETSKEIARLVEFSEILHSTANELYDLF
ncbi:MAG: hypothetical protein WCG95_04070 [bacterium]